MRVGVDTGGTFTDFVAVGDDGTIRVGKALSTPDDAARAVLEGVRALVGEMDARAELVVGTTVATNALLERSGGPVALVTTRGFEDVLALRRQTRPSLYALSPSVAAPLIAEVARIGVVERCGARGEIVTALSNEEVARVVDVVRGLGVKEVALCLLHSPMNAAHEERLERAFVAAGFRVSRSSRVAPIPREYERTSTTVVDAYVASRVEPFVARVADGTSAKVYVMQSTGGAVAASEATGAPVRMVLSGPAAGVCAARALAQTLAIDNVITLDMGGTSTDVSLIENREAGMSQSAEIADLVIQLPMLAVHTVGAGGGSIARLDVGGALVLGPQSAGATPGPAAYGRGGERPTVTDANVVLERLAMDAPLGGTLTLDRGRAERAIETIAESLGGLRQAAEQIVALAELKVATAIRRITIERGHDPKTFALMAFGGAGPLHAVAIARELGISRVIIPAEPGLFCAYGALVADIVRDRIETLLLDAASIAPAELARRFDEDATHRSVLMRYRGQSFELDVPWTPSLSEDFHRAHEARFGYALKDTAIELVALRSRKITARTAAPWPRRVLPDKELVGPRAFAELSATTYLPDGVRGRIDLRTGAILIDLAHAAS